VKRSWEYLYSSYLATPEIADKCGFLLNQICRFQEITYFVTPFGLMKWCLSDFKDFSLALRGYFLNQLLF